MQKLVAIIFTLFLAAACQTKPVSGSALNSGAHHGSTITPGTQTDLEANVGDRVFFAFDSSALSAEAQATLTRQANWLKQYPNVTVTVEGNTDDRGTREYNLALGDRRAHAAKKFLVNMGIETARISTISYGKERPAVLGTGEAVWSQNRRAVTVVNQ